MSHQVHDHALEYLEDDTEALRIEDNLWWIRGRKEIIRKYLAICTKDVIKPTIMDVGCGSGGNLDVLREFGEVFGVEPSAVLARRARGRNLATAIYEEDVASLVQAEGMNVFTLFDVLEHIEDDRGFLSSMRNRAGKPHRLLLSVPACPALYGDHDVILHHFRRYNRGMLHEAITSSGYKLKFMSYHMTLTFPLAIAVRVKDKILKMLGKKKTSIELGDVPPVLSAILQSTLTAEARCVPGLPLPFGLWLFAVAESP